LDFSLRDEGVRMHVKNNQDGVQIVAYCGPRRSAVTVVSQRKDGHSKEMPRSGGA